MPQTVRASSSLLLVLLLIAFAPAAARMQAPPRRPPPLVQVHLVETVEHTSAGPVRIVQVQLESTRLYPCNPPRLPLVHRADIPSVIIDIGAVQWPSRHPLSPCSMREGPALGSVAIAMPPPGRYSLTLRRGGHSDRYAIVVSNDTLELVERRVSFSRRAGPPALTRVPEEAIVVLCSERSDERCQAPRTPPRPTCDGLRSEPALSALTPLASSPPYSMRDFNLPGDRYVTSDLTPLRALMQTDYLDPHGCLSVAVATGRGELLRNLP